MRSQCFSNWFDMTYDLVFDINYGIHAFFFCFFKALSALVLQLFAAARWPTLPAWCCLLIGPRPTTRGRTASGASTWKRTSGSCSIFKCKALHPGVRVGKLTHRGLRGHADLATWNAASLYKSACHLFRFTFSPHRPPPPTHSHRHTMTGTWECDSVVAVAN